MSHVVHLPFTVNRLPSTVIKKMTKAEVCILGAGPGGIATAMMLDKLGIPSTVLDKAVFPRDKVCGDAISGKVVYGFNRIDKAVFQEFSQADAIKANCWGIKFFFPNERGLHIPMPVDEKKRLERKKAEAFVSKRIDFDNFLVEKAKTKPHITIKEGVNITFYERKDGGFILKDKKTGFELFTKLLIDASGAQSKFAREFGGMKKESKHYAAAVRAYYKNVGGCDADNSIELHFIKEIFPGYLWIFPLPNGHANVGVGMRTDKVRKYKVNLKKEMQDVLKNHPKFKDRFVNAELQGKILGFGLPFGSKKRKISGDNYMLVGDAASLIDPVTGEGIGNAVISGWFAAQHAQKVLAAQNYTADFMKAYDKMVYHKLWKELQISYQLQRSFQNIWSLNLVSLLAFRNKRFIDFLRAAFSDIDLRKKLSSPKFYLGLLFNR